MFGSKLFQREPKPTTGEKPAQNSTQPGTGSQENFLEKAQRDMRQKREELKAGWKGLVNSAMGREEQPVTPPSKSVHATPEPTVDMRKINAARDILRRGNEKEKEQCALGVLGINADAFNCIHTQDLKKKHLKYKTVKQQFKYLKLAGTLSEECLEGMRLLIEDAYEFIDQESTLLMSCPQEDQYHKASRGISEIDVFALQENQVDEAQYFDTQPKTAGVEPGFRALQAEDLYLYIFEQNPSSEACWDYIRKHNADVDECAADCKKSLPTYLIKLDYKKINAKGMVSPDDADLARTSTYANFNNINPLAGKAYLFAYRLKKQAHFSKINIDAIREVVANDIARSYGVEVQDQRVYLDYYTSGHLKILLKAAWVDNANILTPLGGNRDRQAKLRKNGNYRIQPMKRPAPRSGNMREVAIEAISDASIPNFGRHLPLLTVQSDRDAIGSQGQNKLIANGRFVGIDFGHAYPDHFVKVNDDFTIAEENFKNYSVFYDQPRSEFVKGLLILARHAGEQLDEQVIRSYGPAFYAEIAAIEPGVDSRIFDDYIRKFAALQSKFSGRTEIDRANRDCCASIVKDLQEVKKRAVYFRQQYLQQFKHYLHCEKTTVDLLENFEKIIAGQAGTSLRSEDRTVLLNRLRITNGAKVRWESKKTDQGQMLMALFDSPQEAKLAASNLAHFIGNPGASLFTMSATGNVVTLVVPHHKLRALSEVITEAAIKEKFHPDDFRLYNEYLPEQKLLQALPRFAQLNAKAELVFDETRQIYKLIIMPKGDKPIEWSSYELRKLSDAYPDHQVDGTKSQIEFPPEKLASVYALVADMFSLENKEGYLPPSARTGNRSGNRHGYFNQDPRRLSNEGQPLPSQWLDNDNQTNPTSNHGESAWNGRPSFKGTGW